MWSSTLEATPAGTQALNNGSSMGFPNSHGSAFKIGLVKNEFTFFNLGFASKACFNCVNTFLCSI
jgi:hypothetical protein